MEFRGRGRELPPERVRMVLRLFQAGNSIRWIERYTGHNRKTVRKILRRGLEK